MIRYEPLKQVQLGEPGKVEKRRKSVVRPVIPVKKAESVSTAADVPKRHILTEGTGLTQLDFSVQKQKPGDFSGFRTGGSGVTRKGGTFSSPYHVEKERLGKEAEEEFAHNTTDWGQTSIRNFAVNPDFPQGAGLVNYIQLLLQSPKGIEYERYTAAEQEAEKTKQIEKITDWANQNGRSPFLSKLYGEEKNGILNAPTGLSLLTAPFRGADYVLDALETAYTGAPLPGSTPNFTETTQALREGVSQDMGKAGQFVYNAALSTADSLIAGGIGGGSVVGGIILGLGTASDTAHDIINRGGTAEDALIGGAVSGIMEGVFEKLSLGQLNAMKAMPVNSARDVLVNMAKSVVTNTGEEFTTELANTIFDTIFMGELSTYEMTVEGYLSQGKSEAEARRLANMDLLVRLGESAAAGALTGALFGSGASADSYYRSRLAAQGEASLRAGEMPTRGQLQAMNLSESEARGAMVLLGLEQIDNEVDGHEANYGSEWQGGKDLYTVDVDNLHVVETKLPSTANDEWMKRGYDKSPYNISYDVKIVQAGNESFVRVFSYGADGTSNKLGYWLMRKRDIEGLTPAEIADKYALPQVPTHVCDVKIDSGTVLQTGIANASADWGRGGGQQFDTMGVRLPKSAFINERVIGE